MKQNFDLTTDLFQLIYHPKRNAKLVFCGLAILHRQSRNCKLGMLCLYIERWGNAIGGNINTLQAAVSLFFRSPSSEMHKT